MAKILIVEDEKSINDLILMNLSLSVIYVTRLLTEMKR